VCEARGWGVLCGRFWCLLLQRTLKPQLCWPLALPLHPCACRTSLLPATADLQSYAKNLGLYGERVGALTGDYS